VDSVLRQHAFWKARSAYEMIYERMREDQAAELARIALALQLPVDAVGLGAVAANIESLQAPDVPAGSWDPSTLLHREHRMDGRVGYHAEALPAEVLGAIMPRVEPWLRENGYSA